LEGRKGPGWPDCVGCFFCCGMDGTCRLCLRKDRRSDRSPHTSPLQRSYVLLASVPVARGGLPGSRCVLTLARPARLGARTPDWNRRPRRASRPSLTSPPSQHTCAPPPTPPRPVACMACQPSSMRGHKAGTRFRHGQSDRPGPPTVLWSTPAFRLRKSTGAPVHPNILSHHADPAQVGQLWSDVALDIPHNVTGDSELGPPHNDQTSTTVWYWCHPTLSSPALDCSRPWASARGRGRRCRYHELTLSNRPLSFQVAASCQLPTDDPDHLACQPPAIRLKSVQLETFLPPPPSFLLSSSPG
jgi:hypothetical protein